MTRKRLRWLADFRAKSAPGPITGDVTFLPMEAVGETGDYDRSSIRPAAELGTGYSFFQRGDVVRAKVTPCFENGKGAFLKDLPTKYGFGSTELLAMQPGNETDGRYLQYVLNSSEFVQGGEASLYGAHGVKRVAEDYFRNFRAWAPPLSSQQAIANYLDGVTARTASLIRKKERQVALVQERRLALAHALITGAAVPGERVPTGVGWLGSIPAAWRIARIGTCYEVQLGRMLNQERAAGAETRPYIRNVNVRWDSFDLSDIAEMDFPLEARQRYRLLPGDLLVNEGGAGIGRAAVWGGEIEEIYYQKSVHRVRETGHLPVRWLLEWLRLAVHSRVFDVEGNLATIPHVPAEALRAHALPVPPSAAIAATLLEELHDQAWRIKTTISALERQIDLLHERRQAVITAAVTGQIEIQGAA